jgi:hypothetical protein
MRVVKSRLLEMLPDVEVFLEYAILARTQVSALVLPLQMPVVRSLG